MALQTVTAIVFYQSFDIFPHKTSEKLEEVKEKYTIHSVHCHWGKMLQTLFLGGVNNFLGQTILQKLIYFVLQMCTPRTRHSTRRGHFQGKDDRLDSTLAIYIQFFIYVWSTPQSNDESIQSEKHLPTPYSSLNLGTFGQHQSLCRQYWELYSSPEPTAHQFLILPIGALVFAKFPQI